MKNLYGHFDKIAFYTVSLALLTVTGMLFKQYYDLKQEAEKLHIAKEEYDHYILMMKKSIKDSSCDFSVEEDGDEKKSDEQIQNDESFLTVNRDPQYLQNSYTTFLTKQQADEEFQLISSEDEKQLKSLRQKSMYGYSKFSRNKKAKYSRQSMQFLKKFVKQSAHRDFVFHWPLHMKDFWISSLFGPRKHPNGTVGFHYGIDMAALKGTPVKAAASGIVCQAQYVPGYGNTIVIQHSKDYRTRYAHLNMISVTMNQKVVTGEVIGEVGDTGCVRKNGHDASHLHFEVCRAGKHVNPLRYLFT